MECGAREGLVAGCTVSKERSRHWCAVAGVGGVDSGEAHSPRKWAISPVEAGPGSVSGLDYSEAGRGFPGPTRRGRLLPRLKTGPASSDAPVHPRARGRVHHDAAPRHAGRGADSDGVRPAAARGLVLAAPARGTVGGRHANPDRTAGPLAHTQCTTRALPGRLARPSQPPLAASRLLSRESWAAASQAVSLDALLPPPHGESCAAARQGFNRPQRRWVRQTRSRSRFHGPRLRPPAAAAAWRAALGPGRRRTRDQPQRRCWGFHREGEADVRVRRRRRLRIKQCHMTHDQRRLRAWVRAAR